MRRLSAACLLVFTCLGSAPATWGNEPMWAYISLHRSRVKVLDRGAEPRAPLRWGFVAGKREAGTLTVEARHSTPGLDSRASAQVTSLTEQVSSTAEAKCRLTFDKIQWTSAGHWKATPEEMATWDGSVHRLLLNAKGGRKWIPADEPAKTRNEPAHGAAVWRLIHWHAPHLPAEPVGVGARWEIVGKPVFTWDGLETSLCTLKSRDGDRITIDVALTRTAEPGQIQRLVDDAETRLVSYLATGTGTYELDLTCVLPVRATMNVAEQERATTHLRKTKYGFEANHSSSWSITLAAGPALESTPR